MGFSSDESMVRVDFFKPNGKWYETEAVKWTGDYLGPVAGVVAGQLIHNAFARSLHDHLFKDGRYRMSGMRAICLEPYHEYSHPISLDVDKIKDYLCGS